MTTQEQDYIPKHLVATPEKLPPFERFLGIPEVSSLAASYVGRLKAMEITVDGYRVIVDCLGWGQAEDVADIIALTISDQIAAWERVAATEVPLDPELLASALPGAPLSDGTEVAE